MSVIPYTARLWRKITHKSQLSLAMLLLLSMAGPIRYGHMVGTVWAESAGQQTPDAAASAEVNNVLQDTATQANHSASLLQQGQAQNSQGNFAMAIALFEQSVQQATPLTRIYPQLQGNIDNANTGLAYAHHQLGLQAGKAKAHADAITQFEQAISLYTPLQNTYPQLQGNLAEAWAMLGIHANQLGDTYKAIAAYQKALTLLKTTEGPTKAMRAHVCADLGNIFMLQNHLNQAKPLLEEAIALGHPNTPTLQGYLTQMNNLASKSTTSNPDGTPLSITVGDNFLAAITSPYQLWDNSHRQLRIYIQPGPSAYTQAVKSAFDTWQNSLDGLFTFTYVNDPLAADSQVLWREKPKPQQSETPEGHDSQYEGGYNLKLRLGPWVVSNDIYFSLTTPQGLAPSPQDMQNTALHEIGHMLGIEGHSPSPGDIMTAVSPESHIQRALTRRDINTLLGLYDTKTRQAALAALPAAEVCFTPANLPLVRFGRYQQYIETANDFKTKGEQAAAAEQLENAMALFSTQASLPSPTVPGVESTVVMLSDAYMAQRQYDKATALLLPWVSRSSSWGTAIPFNFIQAWLQGVWHSIGL
jgi:tetratricopeptide (TPR) repeat protein